MNATMNDAALIKAKIDGEWQIVAKTFAHTGPSAGMPS